MALSAATWELINFKTQKTWPKCQLSKKGLVTADLLAPLISSAVR